MPFRFLEDVATADVAFEAWGKNREEMFTASAAALLRTMAESPDEVVRQREINIRLEHEELDLLLLSFLQELIYHKDASRLLLHADKVRIDERTNSIHLMALVSGEKIDANRHRLLVDVKAVTLHLLQIVYTDNLWRAVVVLDV